ncbi:hypothetical protein HK102_004054, partial [Quaeritorhiza haematococci]
HKGTGFKPKQFTVEEKKTYYLCGCKLTENAPFCDGTHRQEKGIKKYNEFLLKKNTDLQTQLAKTENHMKLVAALSTLGVLVAFLIGRSTK